MVPFFRVGRPQELVCHQPNSDHGRLVNFFVWIPRIKKNLSQKFLQLRPLDLFSDMIHGPNEHVVGSRQLNVMTPGVAPATDFILPAETACKDNLEV